MTELSMEFIDFDKINNDDKKYVYTIFYEYLRKLSFVYDDNNLYYYQYTTHNQHDQNQSIYEILMKSHMICIMANDLRFAKLINIILRILIDDNIDCLKNLTDDDGNLIEFMSYGEFFNYIELSKKIKMYSKYNARTPKLYNDEYIQKYITINKKRELLKIYSCQFDPIRIFNTKNILTILKHILKKELYKNIDNTLLTKKEKLLSILKQGYVISFC